tara:strand:- start:244 stop:768 length:525 start_codon:yes stop_codon:yes gene_type:complete
MIDKIFSLATGFDDWISTGLDFVGDIVSEGKSGIEGVFDSKAGSGFLDIARSGLRSYSKMQGRSGRGGGSQGTAYGYGRNFRPERFRNPMYSGQGGASRGSSFGYNMPQISNAHARLAARIGSGGLSDPQLDKVFRTAINLQQGRRTIGHSATGISRRVAPAQPAQVTKQVTRR